MASRMAPSIRRSRSIGVISPRSACSRKIAHTCWSSASTVSTVITVSTSTPGIPPRMHGPGRGFGPHCGPVEGGGGGGGGVAVCGCWARYSDEAQARSRATTSSLTRPARRDEHWSPLASRTSSPWTAAAAPLAKPMRALILVSTKTFPQNRGFSLRDHNLPRQAARRHDQDPVRPGAVSHAGLGREAVVGDVPGDHCEVQRDRAAAGGKDAAASPQPRCCRRPCWRSGSACRHG